MIDSTGTNSKSIHADIVKWQQCLEREYSLRELKGLCLRLDVDPENIPHATKPELSRELVGYLHRRDRMADLEAEHEKHRANRRDTLDAYQLRLLKETQYIELKGIPVPSGRDGRIYKPQVPLDKVYIQIQAIPEETKKQQEAQEQEALEAKAREPSERKASGRARLNFWAGLRVLGEYFYRQGHIYQAKSRPQPVYPQEALIKHEQLVLLGPPGSGKSTLLRFLARRAIKDEPGLVPILVSLRDFAIDYSQNRSLNLLDFALNSTAGNNEYLRLELEVLVEQGRALWLLDALDETRHHSENVARQACQLPGRLVITSRPAGYSGGMLNSLPHFEILPLTPDNINQFIHNWMRVFTGDENDIIEQKVADLQAQLNNRPKLKAIARNPLMLTFVVALASQSTVIELPQKRSLLYSRYIEELRNLEIQRQSQASEKLSFRFQLGSLHGEKAKQAAIDGLNYLGWALHLNYYGAKGEDVPEPSMLSTITRQLAHYLKQEGYDDGESLAKEVLNFWQEAGLLDLPTLENHTYLAFRHLTFQEYAAAWGLQRAWEYNQSSTWRFLKPRLHHPSWREPILLWSSMILTTDLTPLVRQLRRGISQDERTLHRDLLLAAAMLGESQRGDKKLARKIVRRLAWLGRRHQYKKFLLLLLVYVTGLVPALIAPIVVVILFWTPFFLDCFMRDDPTFPRLRTILSFPLRIGGLATTPLFPVYGVITSVGDPIEILPYLIPALKIDDAYESDIDNLEGYEVRDAAYKALDQIIDVLDIEAMPKLLVALRNKNEGVRAYAAHALGKIGDAAAVPHLITAIRQDKGYRVSIAAANALLQIKDVAAIPHFIVALQDENENIRRLAVESLGQIGDTSATPHLIRTLQDKARDVRSATIVALGQIGDTAAIPHLLIDLQSYHKEPFSRLAGWSSANALVQILVNTADIPYLLTILQNQEKEMREAAARSLGQIGDASATPHLITTLHRDNDCWVRQAATKALGQIGDTSAVSCLITTLQQDIDKGIRQAATEALGQIGDPTTVSHLITALQQDDDIGVRKAAAGALGQIGDASAIPHLSIALEQKRYEEIGLREAAINALGQIGSPNAIPILIAALQEDSDIGVRRSAAKVLGQIGDASAVPHLNIALQDRDYDLRKVAEKSLEQIDNIPTIPDLLMGLQASNKDLRVSSANLLGQIGDATAAPHLLTALQDEVEDVRVAAIKALGQVGDVTAVPHLLTALQDEFENVRVATVKALGQIGDESAIPHLISLPNKPKRVRLVVVEAMGQIGHASAVPYLITALQSGWEDVNQAAASALGQIGDTSAVSPLISALHRDSAVWTRRAAAAALGNIAITANDLSLLESIRHALWWQISDISFTENTVAQAAYSALEQVTNRITELSVSQLNLIDPLGPLPPPHPVRRWLRYSLWIVTTAIIAVLIETAANLLSNALGSNFPAGIAGALVLISALIFFLSINRKLEG